MIVGDGLPGRGEVKNRESRFNGGRVSASHYIMEAPLHYAQQIHV